MTLSVCPIALSKLSEASTLSGIEIATINVLRQLPRKSRMKVAVNAAAISPS